MRWLLFPQLKCDVSIYVQVALNKVLLVGTKTSAYIGKPVVTNAVVHAVVEEQVVSLSSPPVVHFFVQIASNFIIIVYRTDIFLMQGLNPKVIVFKYKKKKNYRRNIGHRQVQLLYHYFFTCSLARKIKIAQIEV